METFTEMIKYAEETNPNAFVIAGNLFNFSKISIETISFIVDSFKKIAHIPVIITPGDQDPYTIGSFYTSTDWGKNVFIFKNDQLEPYPLENCDVTIWGAACKNLLVTPESLAPPNTSHFKQGNLNIVTFHGIPFEVLKPQVSQKAKSFPFHIEAFTQRNFNNLFIGHHSTFVNHFSHNSITFCGSPFFNQFNDLDSGSLVEVEFDSEGQKRVKRVPVAKTNLQQICFDISQYNTNEALLSNVEKAILKLATLEDVILLTLVGKSQLTGDLDIKQIEEHLNKFFYVKIDNQVSDFINWSQYLDDPSLKGAFIRMLLEKESFNKLEEEEQDSIIYYGLTAIMKRGELKIL